MNIPGTDMAWPVLNRLMGLHTWIYQRSGGRVGQDIPGIRGRMLLLEHVGARSGKKRISPLLYIETPDGDVAIIASKGGYPKHPAWFHNLKANPDTVIQIGPERRPVHARVATGAEREQLWKLAEEAYAGYRGYQERTNREIPVVVLERRHPSSGD